ncbi:MAG: discoidin domain-containing protein [Lentisphaeria bacterium]|nr:discoidin domain-containing protein [Lentisphaeria bacterium]
MKTALIVGAVLAASTLLQGAENLMKKPETTYKVDPGTWNEAAGKSEKLARLVDPDLDRETGKRKGLLADGKAFQQGVAYNYANVKKEKSFVTIDVDLSKPQELSEIKVKVTVNNNIWNPDKVEILGSADGKEFKPLASGAEWAKGENVYVKSADFKGEWKDCRYVRIKVFTPSSWINVTEIEIYDK